MSWLESLRRWIWKTEERSNELEYSVLGAIDRAEATADEHTGGRVGHALETVEEESRELLERLHLDGGPGDVAEAEAEEPDDTPG